VPERQRTVLSIVALAVPAFLLLLTGVLAGLPADAGTIERGVRVAGVDVGGRDWEATRGDLQARFADFLAQTIVVRAGGARSEMSLRDLGASVDLEATRQRAEAVGRGALLDATSERMRAHTRGVDVAPVVVFDTARLAAALDRLAGSVISAPTNAEYTYQGDALSVRPSVPGAAVDTAAAAALIEQRVATLDDRPLDIPLVAVPPAVTTADLTSGLDDARALAGAPLQLTNNGTYWQIAPTELVRLLVYRDDRVTLDMVALGNIIGTLSAGIDKAPSDAAIEFREDGTFAVVPEADARRLDVPASLAEIEVALARGQRLAHLVVTTSKPELTAAQVEPLVARANDIARRGMLVWWEDGEQWLDAVPFAGSLRIDVQNGQISFDHAALAAVLEPIAQAINRPATGLRWRDGSIVGTPEAQPGRSVDLGASTNAVASAALGGQESVELIVNHSTDPAQSAASIAIREVLGSASTYYGFSSANRRANVELAAASVNGALVEPGGTFSFNTAIGGTATLDDGYQMGYGIITGDDGSPRTIPSVAGGICQVATTVFQAAFWSGMPIGTRNWHLYWIPAYGEGPGGLQGLDATVDPESGLDFTFHNPTPDWLAIRAVADGEWLTVEVWGTNQGWQIHVDDPSITNVVKADPTPRRQVNTQLQPGEEVVVEHAYDGFTSSIHRVVTDSNGQVVDDTTFVSYYLPSQNVTLVGPGGDTTVPTEEPEATPVPTETPVEETPVVEETPTVEETPVIEETPTVEESPTIEETPTTEETPVPEENATEETVETE
jgi:vancomycin resistance protein YoaR